MAPPTPCAKALPVETTVQAALPATFIPVWIVFPIRSEVVPKVFLTIPKSPPKIPLSSSGCGAG